MRDGRCIVSPDGDGNSRHYGCSCDDAGLVRVRADQVLVSRAALKALFAGASWWSTDVDGRLVKLNEAAVRAYDSLFGALHGDPALGDADAVAPQQPEHSGATSAAGEASSPAVGLLPCSFCGAAEVGVRHLPAHQGAPAIFAACCVRCEVQVQWEHSRDAARAAWNRRAPLDAFSQAFTALDAVATNLSPRAPGDETGEPAVDLSPVGRFVSAGGWSSAVLDGDRPIIRLDWFEEGICVEAAASVEFVQNEGGHRFSLRGSCECCGPFVVPLSRLPATPQPGTPAHDAAVMLDSAQGRR